MLTKDEYVAKMKRQLDDWSADIDALDLKVQAAKDDARMKYQEQLTALRVKREEGEKKLEEIKLAADNSWEMLKAETDNVWEAFKDAMFAFKGHFK